MQRYILDFVGRTQLSDTCLQMSLDAMFEVDQKVHVVSASVFGSVHGVDSLSLSTLQTAVDGGFDAQYICIPLAMYGNHWCGVVIDRNCGVVCYYDPASSYAGELEAIARQKVLRVTDNHYRVRRFVPDAVQLDNYNCGVFLLMFFESYVAGSGFAGFDRDGLQCIRLRYMVQALEILVTTA